MEIRSEEILWSVNYGLGGESGYLKFPEGKFKGKHKRHTISPTWTPRDAAAVAAAAQKMEREQSYGRHIFFAQLSIALVKAFSASTSAETLSSLAGGHRVVAAAG